MAPKMTIVNPWHWLQSDGSLPLGPPRLRALSLRVAQCIEYGGPLPQGHTRETLIGCRRRPAGQACPGLLWVLKQEDDAIHAFCIACRADEFLIYEWQDTEWAEGPMEPVDVAEEARQREAQQKKPPDGKTKPPDADTLLSRALELVGSPLQPEQIRRVMQQSDHPSAAIQAILDSAKGPPSAGALERLMPALMDVWNSTPRADLGGQSPSTVHARRAPTTAAPKVGRNDPCPCGSGNKYKRCCLRDAPN